MNIITYSLISDFMKSFFYIDNDYPYYEKYAKLNTDIDTDEILLMCFNDFQFGPKDSQ